MCFSTLFSFALRILGIALIRNRGMEYDVNYRSMRKSTEIMVVFFFFFFLLNNMSENRGMEYELNYRLIEIIVIFFPSNKSEKSVLELGVACEFAAYHILTLQMSSFALYSNRTGIPGVMLL